MPKDVDADAESIRVLHGKGGRARTIGVDAGAMVVLADWTAVRAELDLPPLAHLFCSTTGRRLTDAYIRRLLPHLGRKARIPKRVHAHGLRHTHAAELRSEGIDIGVISKQLGHRSIATTARYLDHIMPTDVIRTMQAREWTLCPP